MTALGIPTTGAQAKAPGQPHLTLTTLTPANREGANSLLSGLSDKPHTEPTQAPGDEYFHFKNWLIGTSPEGLLEATLDDGVGIGVGSFAPDGTAHAALATEQLLIADHPESPALEVLRALIRQWWQEGAPRTHELRGRLVRDGDAWHIRIARA
ncbi:hypothetical protein [Streptomyces sp. 8N616]|uniref:hypothetical protein n=1 Tax=Streptomyces sp. 8N616 TaxID=3457414 RepID=UPI003FD26624